MFLNKNCKLTIIVLVNLVVIRNNCDCDLIQTEDETKPADLLDDVIIVDNRDDKKDIEAKDEPNINNNNNIYMNRFNETHNTEVTSPTTYEDDNDKVVSEMDSRQTDATTETLYLEYSNNSAGEFNKNYSNESELTLRTTNNAMEIGENTSPITEGIANYDNSGQRNPKTEADQQSVEERSFEKNSALPLMSKSSTLKSWLEDSWLRPPAGILVPLRPLALNRALGVWNDLADEGLNVTDIVIVGYDSNGVNWRSRHNLQSSIGNGERAVGDALSKLLLNYQDVYTDSTNDGTMRALASAAKLVPYDSALFLVTDKGAGDPQRLPIALRALVEKRLKVYTIWTDPNHPSVESELALQDLRNISSHTEGEVLPYSLQMMDGDHSSNLASEVELQQWEPNTNQARKARVNNYPNLVRLDTLLVRRARAEALTLGIPVETGVTALRIVIEGAVEHAVLYPPNDGSQIDLYNDTSIKMFSPASYAENTSPREVFIVFPGYAFEVDMLSVLPVTSLGDDVTAMVGTWHLSVRCDTCDYKLIVSARTHIHFNVAIDPKDMLNVQVTGPVASIRDSSIVDEYGTLLAKLQFSYQPGTDNRNDQENTMADIFTNIPLPDVSAPRVYVKIAGRDFKGETFARFAGPINEESEIRLGRSAAIRFPEITNDLEIAEETNSRSYNEKLQNDYNTEIAPSDRSNTQVLNQVGRAMVTVQIGLSSKLYGVPGDRLQLHFEVTNTRDRSIQFRFGAAGELKFLTGIEPEIQTISAGQTANVIVSLFINTNAQGGVRDLIKFTAYVNSAEEVSRSAYVYVMTPGNEIRDVAAPDVRHNFQGTCVGRQGNDCAEHVWSATVIARDPVGGLLRVSSSPPGLSLDPSFISGSRSEIIATYRATCCSPRVIVNAIDAFGNTNSYTIDISSYLTGASIAAITLGVILIIVLIIIIILLIYWCVKRRKESRELPSYSTTRNL